jgi:hypothetical protein
MTFVWVAEAPQVTDVALLSFARFILAQRLQRKLVTDAKVAQGVDVEVHFLGDSLMFWVDVVLRGSHGYQRTEVLVADVVRTLHNEPIEHRSLEEARSGFATSLATNYERLALHPAVSPGQLLQAGLDADAAALMGAVRRYLPLDRCLVAALASWPEAPDLGEVVRQWDAP